MVDITMYYWGGEKYGIKIGSECEECDINMGILEAIKDEEFQDKPVNVTIKPWLTNVWESLAKGGWHAPVVLVNGKIISQGVVVDREELAAKVDAELEKGE